MLLFFFINNRCSLELVSCMQQVTRSGDVNVGGQEGFHLMVCDTAILFIFLPNSFAA
jgi:hypothetical protein